MLDINIRPATNSDIHKLVEIEQICFLAPWKEKELNYELNENPVSNVFVLEIDNQIVGYYDYWVTFDSATIAQIAVLPNYRKNGYGKMMLDEIIKDCKIAKVRSITLEVRKNNEIAQKLYKSRGFKEILIKEKYYSNGDDAIYMIREGDVING